MLLQYSFNLQLIYFLSFFRKYLYSWRNLYYNTYSDKKHRGTKMYKFQSKNLKELRKKFNMSQTDLAGKLGISNRAISKWELGISNPSAQNMISIAKIFNVPIEYLIDNHSAASIAKKDGGMESITELYKIGRGPSSSHTIGPERACMIFKQKNPSADSFKVTLFGSLAKTGSFWSYRV